MNSILVIGLGLVIAGRGLCTMTMWDCGKNFSRRIAFDKSKEHVLISSGIYHYLSIVDGFIDRLAWVFLSPRRLPVTVTVYIYQLQYV